MPSTPKQILLVAGIALANACAPGAGESRAPATGDLRHSDTGYAVGDEFAEPGDVRLGNRGPGSSGGFSVSVGADFGRPQAEEVLRRLVALDSAGEFDQFTCGEKAPHFGFDITVHRESELQEHIVTLGHSPYPQPWGADQCLSSGFQYLVARTFAQVDTGPSVDYGYTNPSTGAKYPPTPPGERHSRWWPTCHCEMARDNPEWVTKGPEETSLGADAH
jgi:hypothetical protein